MGEDAARQETERRNRDPTTAVLALKIISPQLSEKNIVPKKKPPNCHSKDLFAQSIALCALLESKIPLFKHCKGWGFSHPIPPSLESDTRMMVLRGPKCVKCLLIS